MRVKKDLKDFDVTFMNLPAVTRLYVLIIEDCRMKPRNCGTRKKYFLVLLLVVELG